MMDTDPDDTVEFDVITGDDPDGRHDDQDTAWREGPAAVAPETGGRHGSDCGATAGCAHFMVLYRAAGGGVDLAEFDSCCRLHEPAGFTVLLDEAEVIQTDIADGYQQVIRTDTQITTLRTRALVTSSTRPSRGHGRWLITIPCGLTGSTRASRDGFTSPPGPQGPVDNGWQAASNADPPARMIPDQSRIDRPGRASRPERRNRYRSRTASTGKCAASKDAVLIPLNLLLPDSNQVREHGPQRAAQKGITT
jgi:hypothetical protein